MESNVKALVLPVGGPARVVTLGRAPLGQLDREAGEGSTYPALVRLLDGGYLEGIGGDFDGVRWSGYCDEEGKLKGLPMNVAATSFAQAVGWPVSGDVLCGPVVFVGPPDEEGFDTSVPEALIVVARVVGLLPPAV